MAYSNPRSLFLVLLTLWTGLAVAMPATKLEPIKAPNIDTNGTNNQPTKLQAGAILTDRLELNLPLKISKEELVHWVTHAMRLMASRINITLESVAVMTMPPEKMDKLRNCSIALTRLSDKMSSFMSKNGTKKAMADKIKSLMPSGFKQNNLRKDSKSKSDCGRAEDATSTTEKSSKPCDSKHQLKNNEVTMSPLAQSFSKNSNVDKQNSYNPISKYVQELTIVSPYSDPNAFPPYDPKHQVSLPLEPTHPSERLKYKAEDSKNATNRVGQTSYNARQDLLGSLQFVPLKAEIVGGGGGNSIATSHQNKIDLSHLTNAVSSLFSKHQQQQTNSGETPKPILSLPFEAFITIHRDAKSPEVNGNKKAKKGKNREQDHHEASTSNAPESVLSPDGRAKKKGRGTSGKTTFSLEGEDEEEEEVTTDLKKSNKKKKTAKKQQQPPALQFILRMLGLANNYRNNSGSSSSDGSSSPFGDNNIFTALIKKSPKLARMLKGKRNVTKSEKQEEGDDEDGGGGVPERDIFDDDFDDPPRGGNDDYDYDDGGGSLGSLEDLLPLIIPILEDISDPESDTDIGEFLAAAIPLLQGLSEPDPETGEAPDFIGVLGPIVQSLFLGKDGMGSDSGAILGPLVQLIGPFIGPLSGPIIGPLSASLSGEQGSSLGALLSALLAPLSQPVEKGGLSPIAIVTADIISILLKELSKPGSEIDLGAVVSQIIVGTSSGASAGLSGGSKGKHPSYGHPPSGYGAPQRGAPPPSRIEFFQPPPPPRQQQQPTKRPSKSQKKTQRFRPQATQYRPQATHPETPQQQLIQQYQQQQQQLQQQQTGYEQLAAPAHYGHYGSYAVPANTVNPFALLGDAFKEILSSGINLVTAVIGASTASSGASSQESSGHQPPAPAYGPPHQAYGPPQHGGYDYHKPDSYQNTH